MKTGVLEVLVVSARGIKRGNLIGKGGYYVILECGGDTHKTKVSPIAPAGSHSKKALWNQQFTFQNPLPQWPLLTHLTLHIFHSKNSSNLGQTIIHIGGIVTEGIHKGFIELIPARYNVVLGDGSYKGEIKIGFKFTSVNRETKADSFEGCESSKEVASNEPIWRSFVNLCKTTFGNFFFPYKKSCFSSSKTNTN